MLNPFGYKSEEETKNMIRNFWEDLEHIPKLKILLRAYPDIGGICKIEAKGINGLWDKIPLEQKKNIYIDQWKN